MAEKTPRETALEAEVAQLKDMLSQRDRQVAQQARDLAQKEQQVQALRRDVATRDDTIAKLQARASTLAAQRNLAGAAAGAVGLFALRSLLGPGDARRR